MDKLTELFNLYEQLWKQSKDNATKYRENTKIKYNREGLLRETARKECYADFINNLTGLNQEWQAMNNIILEQQDHINAIGAERDKMKFTVDQIKEAITELWREDFGDLKDDTVERDGYFVLGFLQCAVEKKFKVSSHKVTHEKQNSGQLPKANVVR